MSRIIKCEFSSKEISIIEKVLRDAKTKAYREGKVDLSRSIQNVKSKILKFEREGLETINVSI